MTTCQSKFLHWIKLVLFTKLSPADKIMLCISLLATGYLLKCHTITTVSSKLSGYLAYLRTLQRNTSCQYCTPQSEFFIIGENNNIKIKLPEVCSANSEFEKVRSRLWFGACNIFMSRCWTDIGECVCRWWKWLLNRTAFELRCQLFKMAVFCLQYIFMPSASMLDGHINRGIVFVDDENYCWNRTAFELREGQFPIAFFCLDYWLQGLGGYCKTKKRFEHYSFVYKRSKDVTVA